MKDITFFVAGIPRPGGSKRVFPIKKGGAYTGRFIVTDAAGQANKDWRASVAHEAQLLTANPEHTEWFYFGAVTCPLELELHFVLPRPKGHWKEKGYVNEFGDWQAKIKDSAPKHHIIRPDAGKLARSTQDALTGIVWKDDAQIVKETHTKNYGSRPGVTVIVKGLDTPCPNDS